MKNCLIVTGGSIQLDFAGSFLEKHKFDLIIAVDGGLETMKELHLVPHAAVGDFDTAADKVVEYYRKIPGIIWETHRPEKNETDTELAVSTAMNMGAAHITILGGLGGRVDHMLANVQLLTVCLKKEVTACIIDERNRIYLLQHGKEFIRQEQWGTYISFLPFTEHVTGITLQGFRYPLHQKDITMGEEAGLCISNELSEETGTIAFTSGILICVESRD